MQFSLYSLTSPNLKLWTFVASLRSTGLCYQSLGIRGFCFWDSSLYIRNNLRNIWNIQTDRAMNKVEVDNSVKIYKAADALRIDSTTNLTVPKRRSFFTRKSIQVHHERPNLLRLQILPWRGSLTRHVQFLQKKFTEANYFKLELKKQKKLSHTKFKPMIA